MDCSILPVESIDAAAIATLHAESWRTAYRGLVPDAFLDGPVVEDRMHLWRKRLNGLASNRQLDHQSGVGRRADRVRLRAARRRPGPRTAAGQPPREAGAQGHRHRVAAVPRSARVGRPSGAGTAHASVGHRGELGRPAVLRPPGWGRRRAAHARTGSRHPGTGTAIRVAACIGVIEESNAVSRPGCRDAGRSVRRTTNTSRLEVGPSYSRVSAGSLFAGISS